MTFPQHGRWNLAKLSGMRNCRIQLCWNSLTLSMVDKDKEIGLCMALCLEIYLNNLGSCNLVCFRVVLCIARCLEKNFNKLGHCMALCLEMVLNKLGHCMALCLEMVLNKLMRCVALFFLPHRDRALQAGGGSGATLQRIELGGDPLGGVRRQGSMGVGPMPASWESPWRRKWQQSRPARASMWSYATAIWRLALLVRSHHEESGKPTTLAVISISELHQLQGVRGKGVGPKVQEGQPEPKPRAAMTMRERIDNSKLWASWAPGLKAAIAEGLRRWLFASLRQGTLDHGNGSQFVLWVM